MNTERSGASEADESLNSDLSWLLSLNNRSTNDGSISLEALVRPESSTLCPHPSSKTYRARNSKQEYREGRRPKTAAESLGLIKGAKDYRLNSPYLAQPKPRVWTESDADIKAKPETKYTLAPKQRVISKTTDKREFLNNLPAKTESVTSASPITKMYMALVEGQEEAKGANFEEVVLNTASKAINRAAERENRRRMLNLVHIHKNKNPFVIPKIDASTEFGGSVRSTDEKYSEYYKFKLGIDDKQKGTRPLYTSQHSLHFREVPHDVVISEDPLPLPLDPMYRILREQAELSRLMHKSLCGKSEPSRDDGTALNASIPPFILTLQNFVVTTSALRNIATMQKQSSPVWCAMRVVHFLLLAFYELSVKHSSLMSNDCVHLQTGSSTGSVTRTGEQNQIQNKSANDRQSTDTSVNMIYDIREFWTSIGATANSLNCNVYNYCNTFTWELVEASLQHPQAFMHVLGDVEQGECTVPNILPLQRKPSKQAVVAWKTGLFYRAAESDGRLMAMLRTIVSSRVLHPSVTYKSHPCVSVLCNWARQIVAGLYAGRMSYAHAEGAMFRSDTPSQLVGSAFSGQRLANEDTSTIKQNSFSNENIDGANVDATRYSFNAREACVVQSALSNSASESNSAHEIGEIQSEAKGFGIVTHIAQLSPSAKVSTFMKWRALQAELSTAEISTHALQVSNSLPDENAPYALGTLNKVHALHIVAYAPILQWCSSTEIVSSPVDFAALNPRSDSPACDNPSDSFNKNVDRSVVVAALQLTRPCDQLDVLIAEALSTDRNNEDSLKSIYQQMIQETSTSPLHRVLVAPYGSHSYSADNAESNAHNQTLQAPSVVSFSGVRTCGARVTTDLSSAPGCNALALISTSQRNNTRTPDKAFPSGSSSCLERGNVSTKDHVRMESNQSSLYKYLSKYCTQARACQHQATTALGSGENNAKHMRTDAKLHRSKSGLLQDFVTHSSNTTSNVVLVKSLKQIFTRADNYSRDILPSMIVLVPDLDSSGVSPKSAQDSVMSIPTNTSLDLNARVSPAVIAAGSSTISRYVCMVTKSEASSSAFYASLRLCKPGDMLFLVHLVRKSEHGHPNIVDTVAQAQELSYRYKQLGFNLQTVSEEEVAPRGISDSLQLGKALTIAAAMYAPTHVVLGSDTSDCEFALFQNRTSATPSVVEGVIRHEKFLQSVGTSSKRPYLVLSYPPQLC